MSGPKQGRPAKKLTYKFTVFNAGDAAASGVKLTIRHGGVHVTVDKVRGSACKEDRVVSCRLGSIPSGQKVEVEVTVLPEAAGRLTLTATVGGEGAASSPGADRAAGAVRITDARR